MNKEVIASTISEVSGQLIRNWPLYSFVTSNPLAGLEQLHFDDAIKQMWNYMGINGYPSAAVFEQALRENQIDKTVSQRTAPGKRDRSICRRIVSPIACIGTTQFIRTNTG